MLGIVIQARTGSNRLPNKMLLPFHSEKGILELLLEKLQKNFNGFPIIVATTTKNSDNKIIDICLKQNIKYYRGSEQNVLNRSISVGNKFKFTKIIRICADNPFLSIEDLRVLIKKFQNRNLDYLSFKTKKGIPVIKTQYGFWAEGVSLQALKKTQQETNNLTYLEHVTNYIYKNKNHFNTKFITIDAFIEKHKNIRMTLDTYEDYILLQEIYQKHLLEDIRTLKSLIEYVASNKHWLKKMNKQILNNKK